MNETAIFYVGISVAMGASMAACETNGGIDAASLVDVSPGFDAGAVAPIPSLRFVPIELEGGPVAITDFAFLPGATGELLLTELPGTVRHYRLHDDDTTELLGSFRVETVLDAECGLISIAVDPQFERNHFVYVGHCTSVTSSRVSRVTLMPDGYDEAWATAQTIVEVTEPDAPAGWHNVGAMGFEDDSILWVLFGDKTNADRAQDRHRLNGKLLRIVPSRAPDEGGYQPAEGNPFLSGGGDPAVFASGLRSPWRGARDTWGRWWIGDVGNHLFEEVNLVDRGGRDFGWPRTEGPCAEACEGITDPFRHYSHGSGDAIFFEDPEIEPTLSRSVWVGVAYSGTNGDRYEGRLHHRVLWGDFAMGFVRVLEVLPDGEVRADAHVGHLSSAAAWREGPDGWIYGASFGGIDPAVPSPGSLHRAVLE